MAYPMKVAMHKFIPVHYGGRTYLCVEDAICDCDKDVYPYYAASVICIDDSKVDGKYPLYTALWDVLEQYVENTNDDCNPMYHVTCEREEDACDWEHPSDIVIGNDFYNPETGKFCFL